ncbi:hypothetical protein BH18ACT7_BH18ACT7_19910 [soil metagenome]
MSCAFSFGLKNKMTGQLGIFRFYVILNFFTQVTNNEDEFINTGFMQLINIYAEDVFTSQRNQGFWLCIGMWAKLGTGAGYRNYGLH